MDMVLFKKNEKKSLTSISFVQELSESMLKFVQLHLLHSNFHEFVFFLICSAIRRVQL